MEKTPSQWESFKEMRADYKELKAVYGAAKAQVDRDWLLKVGEHLTAKAEAVDINSASDAEIKASSEVKIKADKVIQKADALAIKAEDITFNGTKATFMGGDLVIK